MEIHTFRASSLQEALMLVRHELGPEASVLQTKEINPRMFGLWGKRCVEVTASRDAKVHRRLPDDFDNEDPYDAEQAEYSENGQLDLTESDSQAEQGTAYLDYGTAPASRSNFAEEARTNPADSAAHHAIAYAKVQSASIDSMAAVADSLKASSNSLTPAMFDVFTDMLDAEIEPEAARLMLQQVVAQCTPEQMNDSWMIKGRLGQLIQQQIRVAGPIELRSGEKQVVALVGPTGVGKTTTLAKLAAGFHFDLGTRVGFITLDTFRLGAVDQLQKYADLLGAPCAVVSQVDQMLPAIDALRHCQLILIDTAGRSPKDDAQLGALNNFLRVAAPTQTHLVLSAACSQAHAELAIEQFAELEPTHLLLTKLDEIECLGSWYRLLSQGRWPLSYLTTGQHVPEDIVLANRRKLANIILGQASPSAWQVPTT